MKIVKSDSIDEFNSDELRSLLQQSGRAVCAECSSNIISFPANENGMSQLEDHRRRMKCEECASESNHTKANSGVDYQDNQRVDEQHGSVQHLSNVGGFGSHKRSDTSDPYTCPSKIRVLIADIQDHYYQDKWYQCSPYIFEILTHYITVLCSHSSKEVLILYLSF
jgi:hypothetical protein